MHIQKFKIVMDTHTVCVPYYKAAPYNISHTKIFVRFSQGLKVPLRGTFKPLRLNVRASHARLININIDVLYKDNWLKVPNI